MRIITLPDISHRLYPASAVTIGNFDGVHRGHVELFRHLRREAELRNLPTVVVTFEPHPLQILAPGSAPPMITSFRQKAALIASEGIDGLVVIPFDEQFSSISADDFVENTLCATLGMRHAIIGHDYFFGRGRQGNYATLEKLGRQLDFTLEDLTPVGEGESIFSSSLARRLISEGMMADVARILGRYHIVSGSVIHGREIGRSLGFPTANLQVETRMLPPDGVYAVKVCLDGVFRDGACSVGLNPTFAGGVRSVEVFLFDFNGDLYDRRLDLLFVERLREVRSFASVDLLVQAINTDVANARMILSSAKPEFLKQVPVDLLEGAP